MDSGEEVRVFIISFSKMDVICSVGYRLTCSFEMAQLVERLGAFDLAEFIYRAVDAHYEVASCLLQAGKLQG